MMFIYRVGESVDDGLEARLQKGTDNTVAPAAKENGTKTEGFSNKAYDDVHTASASATVGTTST